MATNLPQDKQDALDWLMKRQISLKSGESVTIMKFLKGDPNNRTDFSGVLIASLLTSYVDELTK